MKIYHVRPNKKNSSPNMSDARAAVFSLIWATNSAQTDQEKHLRELLIKAHEALSLAHQYATTNDLYNKNEE